MYQEIIHRPLVSYILYKHFYLAFTYIVLTSAIDKLEMMMRWHCWRRLEIGMIH
jgi:hypothetical protein